VSASAYVPIDISGDFLRVHQRSWRKTEIFQSIDAFRRFACWNETLSRIAMHLASEQDVSFRIGKHRPVWLSSPG
jgi:uncharacterized SAM-dependent methyltransferase